MSYTVGVSEAPMIANNNNTGCVLSAFPGPGTSKETLSPHYLL